MIATASRTRAVSVWERYVTGTGLTLTLAILLVLAVTWPIQDAGWVERMFPAPITGMASATFTAWLVSIGMRGWRILAWSTGAGALLLYLVGAATLDSQPELYRLMALVGELGTWIAAIGNGSIQSGLTEFAMFLTFVSWLLGYLAVWMAVRLRQAWAAVALGGVTLTIALTQAGGSPTLWLGLFMAAGVLILIHVAIAQRMVGWRAKRLAFEPSTVLWQSLIVLIAGVVIIVGVSVLPTPRLSPLDFVGRSLDGIAQTASDEFSRLFNGLPSRRHVHTLTFDATTRFRGNPNLSADLIFTVEGVRPDYWRARAYTTYAGTGWDSMNAEWGSFQESGAEYLARVPAEYRFNVSAATDSFFTAGLPAAFDEPVEGLSMPGARSDVLQVRFVEGREYFPTRTNVRYTSTGNRTLATARELIATEPAFYPAGVAATYTQLPDDLPQRVRELAAFVTRNAPTTFEKAVAVEQYLLRIPYNLDIPGPPEGADGVDHFLFELRQGYCDYYASSMAVMLRAVGIPARYVLGYTSGFYNPQTGTWDVLQLNYHAWAEVYFPEYGWIRFEPTPPDGIEFGGQVNPSPLSGLTDPIELDGPIPEDEDEDGPFGGPFEPTPTSFVTAGRFAGSLVLAFAALAAIVYYRWWWRLSRYPKADELYAKMGKLATLLGVPPDPAYTPAEFAAILSREVPEHAVSFHEVARIYGSRRYGGKTISMADVRLAEEAWVEMRWPLVRRLFRVRPA